MSSSSSVREMIDAWEAKEWRRMMREKLVETAEELEQTRQDLNTAEEYAASLEKIAKDKDTKIAEYAALVERAKNTNSENLRRLVETEKKLDQVTQHRDALLLDGDEIAQLKKKNEEQGETIRLLREELNEKNILIAQLESASAARPMPTPKPEPVPGWVSANQPIVSLQTGVLDNNPITTDHNSITTMLQPCCNLIPNRQRNRPRKPGLW